MYITLLWARVINKCIFLLSVHVLLLPASTTMKAGQNQDSRTPLRSSRIYSEDNIDLKKLGTLAEEKFGRKPFDFQLRVASAILSGKDVILDAGTGCGKTLCFMLPLLLDTNDISLIISPLSSLMIEQAKSAKLPTVAVCKETLSEVGVDQMYEVRNDIYSSSSAIQFREYP